MANQNYRQEVREGLGEAHWTFWKLLPYLLLGLAVLTVIGWGLKSAGIISMNIEREVVQHSRQYTESKQALLQNLFTQYVGLQTQAVKAKAAGDDGAVIQALEAQQMALLAQMRREATNIPVGEVPAEVQDLIK